ncbi:hypothetical protein VFPPC_16174 [Pochonia chlamydosporia 170]|uniref:Uncharacterized protein n=1 Tax=Pochonia chlamydosporia 170 TaxID=1380566 RepID=A0A179FF81_METCM|nr:hypothetical protein VFPPC_16174 [Pochonia chlamydosporia 170]OAQ64184.1 hypothetical protein VFPPC_16174 [Pochonia chlamydosporia 170]
MLITPVQLQQTTRKDVARVSSHCEKMYSMMLSSNQPSSFTRMWLLCRFTSGYSYSVLRTPHIDSTF